jgi:hypothetical protein
LAGQGDGAGLMSPNVFFNSVIEFSKHNTCGGSAGRVDDVPRDAINPSLTRMGGKR